MKEIKMRGDQKPHRFKRNELDRYIDQMIDIIKKEHAEESFTTVETSQDKEKLHQDHRQNQRRFEYDYEEDFYEPLYPQDEEIG